LVVTFWAQTAPPFNCETATEYAVAPLEAFQPKVGVSVVTVGPGDEVLPGESPAGVGGTAAEFTVKYMIAAVVLDPAEFEADTVQK
jgi:hypothetical protein